MATKRVVCIQCHNACRLKAEVKDNNLLSVEPGDDFPGSESSYLVSKGCPRRRNVIQYFYHPERLNYPLKRLGDRRENRWQQISWDDALFESSARMKKFMTQYGPEAIATTSGTGRTHDEIRQRFFNLLGHPITRAQGRFVTVHFAR